MIMQLPKESLEDSEMVRITHGEHPPGIYHLSQTTHETGLGVRSETAHISLSERQFKQLFPVHTKEQVEDLLIMLDDARHRFDSLNGCREYARQKMDAIDEMKERFNNFLDIFFC